MRMLALLLLAFVPLTLSQDTVEFDRFTLEDIAITEKLLEQAKRDAKSELPFHKFPQVSKRTKRATAPDCPTGYTGFYCESPLCANSTELVSADITDTYFEKKLSSRCEEAVTIYVDSHINFFKIVVQSGSSAGKPGGSLYNATGIKIEPTTHNPQRSAHIYNYRELVKRFGTGAYSFIPSSSTDDDCYVTASGYSQLVLYGGFVQIPYDDNVQQTVPDGHSVQTDPIQNIPSYFAFKTIEGTSTDAPKWTSFHRSNDTVQQFAPLPVLPRYGCSADQYVGPYVCTDDGKYMLKVRGLDGKTGGIWQRVYLFDCISNGEPGPPTASSAPVLECENGGQLIKQGDKNVCYCGNHFEGDTCQTKVCDHGTLNLQGDCDCTDDSYSGDFCQHVKCKQRVDSFNTQTRGLTFVVRANDVGNIFDQFKKSVQKILAYYDDELNGAFEEYSVVLIINGETSDLSTYRTSQSLLENIDKKRATKWQRSTDCADAVFKGVDEALTLTTTTKFTKGPVFLFTDAVSNDDSQRFADLGGRLGAFKSSIYTIYYGDPNLCNINTDTDPKYSIFRRIAQYTHGMAVKVDSSGDAISESAYALALGFFNTNMLAAHDLLDSCFYAPAYHMFFVDDTIVDKIVVAATGPSALKLRILDTNGNTVNSDNGDIIYGDLKLASYTIDKLPKGHYRLAVDAASVTGPCNYRVYARTGFEAFFAATTDLNTDRAFYQPIANRDLHLVATITGFDVPDPENLFAEIVLWKENTDTIKSDRREVLYASSGLYRDQYVDLTVVPATGSDLCLYE